MPYPIVDGGSYSIYHTALGLISQGADLKVFAINTPKNWVDVNNIPDDYKKKTRFEFSVVDTRLNLLKAFFNLFTSTSYFIGRFVSDQCNSDLKRILSNEEFDIIHLEHIYMCLYLDTIRKYSKAKVILRPQNIEHGIWERVIKNTSNPFKKIFLFIATKRLKKFEITTVKKVDGIIAISPDEAKTLMMDAPGTPVINIPPGFDFTTIPSGDHEQKLWDDPVFYHLGSMDWEPNIQGLRWFIIEVIPCIIQDYPEFNFRIAGKKMPQWFYQQRNRNLIVDGEIENPLIYHQDKNVLIIPLLSGGGIRVKIIEGMALGKTIISTSIGAEGIPYTDGKNILIADTKEDFIRQINKCRNSPELCREIGMNARMLAKEHFDRNILAQAMVAFYFNRNATTWP